MVSSGVWSSGSDGHGARRAGDDADEGPWVGPSAAHDEEEQEEQEHEEEEGQGDENEDGASEGNLSGSQHTSHVGDSWVALGESGSERGGGE